MPLERSASGYTNYAPITHDAQHMSATPDRSAFIGARIHEGSLSSIYTFWATAGVWGFRNGNREIQPDGKRKVRDSEPLALYPVLFRQDSPIMWLDVVRGLAALEAIIDVCSTISDMVSPRTP